MSFIESARQKVNQGAETGANLLRHEDGPHIALLVATAALAGYAFLHIAQAIDNHERVAGEQVNGQTPQYFSQETLRASAQDDQVRSHTARAAVGFLAAGALAVIAAKKLS